jgi:hypothetical protein
MKVSAVPPNNRTKIIEEIRQPNHHQPQADERLTNLTTTEGDRSGDTDPLTTEQF